VLSINSRSFTARDCLYDSAVYTKYVTGSFFINASLEERARRRFNQLNDETKNIEQIKEGLLLRDTHDKNRAASPLVVSKGSIEIDTTKKDD